MAKPITIFLAEDNAGDAFLIQEVLRGVGLSFELVRSNDGETALQRLGVC